jgi:hypothetical protein
MENIMLYKLFFFISNFSSKIFGGFHETTYLCTRIKKKASVAQLVRAPDC